MEYIYKSIWYNLQDTDYKPNFTISEWYSEWIVFNKVIELFKDLFYVINIKKLWINNNNNNLSYHFEELIVIKKDDWKYNEFSIWKFLPFNLEKLITVENIEDDFKYFDTDIEAINYFTKIIETKKEIFKKSFEIIKYEFEKISNIFDKEKALKYLNSFILENNYPNDNICNHEAILKQNKNKLYDQLNIDIWNKRILEFSFYEIYSDINWYFYFLDVNFINEKWEKFNVYEYFPSRIINWLQVYKYKEYWVWYTKLKDEINFIYENNSSTLQQYINETHEFYDKFILTN